MFHFLTFDIFLTTWHLFDNLTSFWYFDTFNLNHLSPHRAIFLTQDPAWHPAARNREGLGTMGYYILCRTVHIAPGPGMWPDPLSPFVSVLSRSRCPWSVNVPLAVFLLPRFPRGNLLMEIVSWKTSVSRMLSVWHESRRDTLAFRDSSICLWTRAVTQKICNCPKTERKLCRWFRSDLLEVETWIVKRDDRTRPDSCCQRWRVPLKTI